VALTRGQLVFAEIPTLGPGVVRPVRVTMEPGVYAWRCVSFDGSITVSPMERVQGPEVGDPSPTFTPVAPEELSAAAITYRDSAERGLRVLVVATDSLAAAARSGNRPLTRTDWLRAHLDYERLGAVYDAFGVFNGEINGRADGLVGGVNSPKFTGFLRLEYALWHHQSRATVTAVADSLDRNVHALVEAFPQQPLLITDVPLRAHEIMENALQFELTGDTDEGSHTNLATVRANVDGDRTVLAALRPLLVARDPGLLATAEAQLTTLAGLLDTYRRPDGVWTPVESLSLLQHEQLDADTDAALATLAQMPAQLEVASGDTS
jgi:high-affinity iron transporter